MKIIVIDFSKCKYPMDLHNEIREKSLNQWLNEMENHEDVAVRCGVPLCREYMKYLAEENQKLKEENFLKNEYLKKVKAKLAEK